MRWVVCVVVGLWLSSAVAHATPEDDAVAAAARGDYMAAAAKFREAYAADARPDLICNVGVAYYKAKDLPRAQRYLEQCLAVGKTLDAAFLDSVTKVLKAVVDKLGTEDFAPVDLVVEPDAATTAIDGGVPFDEPLTGSHRIWFPFGHYKLVVHADGFVDRSVEIDAREHYAKTVKVTLEHPVPVVTPPVQTAVPVRPPPPPRLRVHGPSKLPVIVATSVTGVLGAATLLAVHEQRKRADAAGADMLPDPYLSDRADAVTWKKRAWYLGSATAVSALATGYLWYRYLRTPSRVEVQATVSATHAGIALTGAW